MKTVTASDNAVLLENLSGFFSNNCWGEEQKVSM